ncbi:MAG: ATP-binding cassette domain-containing protein [Muribaculaceae bacterium]|nr:ATP-binding cassette domain-containing protein [Bacteroidales bacterium]MDE6242491.1 ATP-binding cassette domain-containing protein [Muribaculaceae bacterium]
MQSITLKNVRPRVFEDEDLSLSQVWDTDLVFTRGQTYVVEAPSGTGKSSLCAYIYGNRRDYTGHIRFDDRDISTITPGEWQKLRRTELAYLPQELDLFPELTAMQNLCLKNDLTGHLPHSRLREWMEALGLADRMDFPVGKMSIGQQQRVAIIRSICQPFSFLLIDEPVSHLDARNNALAAEIIMTEARRQNAAVIATSVGNRIGIPTDTELHL